MKNLSPRDLSSIIGDGVDAVKDRDPGQRGANPPTSRFKIENPGKVGIRDRLDAQQAQAVFAGSPIGYSRNVEPAIPGMTSRGAGVGTL